MDRRSALVMACLALAVCAGTLLLGPPRALAAGDTTSYWPMGGWPHVLTFSMPADVAIDASGNAYVADTGFDRIQKIGPDGSFMTQWGSPGGTSTPGAFDDPTGVALDMGASVYVVDSSNNRVQVFTPTGSFLREWGGAGAGPGQFSAPWGIAIDKSDRVYVVDSGNDRVQRFSSAGIVQTEWGSSGTTTPGQFAQPGGVAVDASGNVYVADTGNNRVQKFDGDGTFLIEWGSFGETMPGAFDRPTGVAVDGSGNVWVCDSGNGRIQEFSSAGTFLSMWGYSMEGIVVSGAPQGPYFRMPLGVEVDPSGSVYVADSGDMRIEKFSPGGNLLANWAGAGPDDGRFAAPVDIAADGFGHVYVCDSLNWRIQKFTSAGEYLDKWGSFGLGFLTNSQARATARPARLPFFPFPGIFMLPTGVACDPSGNVYVSDSLMDNVRWFSPDGAIINGWGTSGKGNGQFSWPVSVAVDPVSRNVYVADTVNSRIQEFSPNGWYLRQWGSFGTTAPAQFRLPRGVAVDPAGFVYVADTDNHRVQKFDLGGTFVGMWGSLGTTPGAFNSPRRIAIDPDHNVLVADAYNNRIQKFDGSGNFITQFGSIGTTQGTVDNPPLVGNLSGPRGVAVDASGTAYVADTVNHRIQVFKRDLDPPVTHASMAAAPSGPGRIFTIDSATDTVSGVTGTYYRLDGGATQTASGLPVNLTVTADGTHTLAYWSQDRAGHVETPKTLTAKVRGFWSVLTLRNSKARVPYKGAVVISGSLVTSGSTTAPVANREVAVWWSLDASRTWAKIATLDTDARGRFSLTKRLERTTQFRAEFAGDADYPPTVSRRRIVRARAWLSAPRVPASVSMESFVITGDLKPVHRQATLLYLWRRVGTRWVLRGTARAINTNYRNYTKYYVRVKVGPPGRWMVKAYHADASHAPSWSSARYFKLLASEL